MKTLRVIGWTIVLIAVALGIVFLAGNASGTALLTPRVSLPVVLKQADINFGVPFCPLDSFAGSTETPGFTLSCNVKGFDVAGAGWMNLTNYDSGWFEFDGCLPVGDCARLQNVSSNVAWSFDAKAGVLTLSVPATRAGTFVGPGYFYSTVSLTGGIGGYGCWPWGDCQAGPPTGIDK